MPAEFDISLVCFDCMRVLTSDATTWSCKPCERGGYYASELVHGRNGEPDRMVLVRMVTTWRRPPEPDNGNERVRRAA